MLCASDATLYCALPPDLIRKTEDRSASIHQSGSTLDIGNALSIAFCQRSIHSHEIQRELNMSLIV